MRIPGGRRPIFLATLLVGSVLAAACSSVTPEELAEEYAFGDLATLPPATDDNAAGALPDDTPLTLDPAVEVGVLDNGLTYYLRENDTPGAEIEVRLVVGAGSLQQEDPDDGVAHFLEHMLFNGTEAFPGNELDRALQSFGLAFGADTNAYTSYHETVYFLRLSTLDEEAVSTGFEVLAEWAERALIEPAEVVAERGVVRDEYRQGRESVDGFVFTALEDIYVAGTPYDGYRVLGDPDRIDATRAPELRAFYDRWYHPENIAVVVVGDLDVDSMRRQVEDWFGGFEARVPAPGVATPFDVEPDPEAITAVITHPDQVGDSISLDWLRPPIDERTVGGGRVEVLDLLIAEMLTRRTIGAYLAGSLELDVAPFLMTFDMARELRYFGTNLRGPDLSRAFEQYLAIVYGAAEYGFTQNELEQAIEVATADLDAQAAGLGTVTDTTFADIYTQHFLGAAGGEAIEDTIARQRAILDQVTPEEVTARWSDVLSASGPIAVSIGADAADVPTADELASIYASFEPVRPVAGDDQIEQLMDAPDPVAPIAVEQGTGWGGPKITWRYENGATVVFEPSPIAEGLIEVSAESFGGFSILPAGSAALVDLATSAVTQSGVGDASASQVRGLVSGSSVTFAMSISPETEDMSGSATPDDAELLFQLLHLSMVEPRIDDTAFRSVLADGELLRESAATDPGTIALLELERLITGTDEYSWIPTADQLDSLTPEVLLELFRSGFSTVDDLVVSVVGDFSAREMANLADRYIGTLPAGPADTFIDIQGDGIAGVQRVDVPLNQGTANGGVYLAWLDQGSWDEDDLATAAVLQQVLNSRIFETIREELGASYGGGAYVDLYWVPRDTAQALVWIDGDPSRLDEIVSQTLAELADLRTSGPTADEMERATAVLEDEWGFVYNADFLFENLALARDPDARLLTEENRLGLLTRVDADDVRALAERVFDPEAYVEVRRT